MTADISMAITAGTYVIDPGRSQVRFTATHALGLGPVTGTCAVRDETITAAPDPGSCAVSARLDAASLSTDEARRDKSIRSKRFLDVQEYPDMLFVSDRLTRDGDGWLLGGQLTVRGAAAPAALAVSTAGGDASGCRFRARAHIDRRAHGVGPRGLIGRYLDLELDVAGHLVSADKQEPDERPAPSSANRAIS